MKEMVDKLNEYLRENRCYQTVDAYGDNFYMAEVTWGDWKHDHLRLEWLVREFAEKNGYTRFIGNSIEVTEEDGSDTYSGIHRFFIAP